MFFLPICFFNFYYVSVLLDCFRLKEWPSLFPILLLVLARVGAVRSNLGC
jgi:hypothetical protein